VWSEAAVNLEDLQHEMCGRKTYSAGQPERLATSADESLYTDDLA